MKRSTLFALLAVVFIMFATVIVLADIAHPSPSNTITFGSGGNIQGITEGNKLEVHADNAALFGKSISSNFATVGAFSGGSAGVRADSGAELWVVGSTSGNHGDVIVVLGN